VTTKRVDLEFIGRDGKSTTDYIIGAPTVMVDIFVGYDPAKAVGGTVNVDFKSHRALVDTGADLNVIDEDLIPEGTKFTMEVDGMNVGVQLRGKVYLAAMSIIGMEHIFAGPVIATPLISKGAITPLILGRHALAQYKFMYDTPMQQFWLEREKRQ
jgi:hypothetical protein